MACAKASTTISTSIARYGFKNRSNLIMLFYLHFIYRYVVFRPEKNRSIYRIYRISSTEKQIYFMGAW